MKTVEQKKECVSIAKDVLLQLKQKLINPVKGTFLRLPYSVKSSSALELQDALLTMAPGDCCSVCAIGGFLLSSVRLYGKFPTIEGAGESTALRKRLREHFTKEEINDMEYAFEMCKFDDDRPINACLIGHTTAQRLAGIARSIIRNKGVFIYEDVKAADMKKVVS